MRKKKEENKDKRRKECAEQEEDLVESSRPESEAELDESELEEDSESLEAKDDKLSEAEERCLRLAAEFDNFRKRSRRESEALYDKCVCDVVTEFLPLLDNLDRAVEAGQTGGADAAEAMLEGVELLKKQALEILAKFDVEEIKALNESFDPNLHEAASHTEDEAYGNNEVIEVFGKGYIRGDRVLRHSVVRVAN